MYVAYRAYTNWLAYDYPCSRTRAVMQCSCIVRLPMETSRSSCVTPTTLTGLVSPPCWRDCRTTPRSASATRTPTSCPMVAQTCCLALALEPCRDPVSSPTHPRYFTIPQVGFITAANAGETKTLRFLRIPSFILWADVLFSKCLYKIRGVQREREKKTDTI